MQQYTSHVRPHSDSATTEKMFLDVQFLYCFCCPPLLLWLPTRPLWWPQSSSLIEMPTRNGADPKEGKIKTKKDGESRLYCREPRHWVCVGFHRRIWGRWRAALIMFNSCFYWPCHWRKPLLHTGWESSHGERKAVHTTDRDSKWEILQDRLGCNRSLHISILSVYYDLKSNLNKLYTFKLGRTNKEACIKVFGLIQLDFGNKMCYTCAFSATVCQVRLSALKRV